MEMNCKKIRPIGLSGLAGTGKDTFCQVLIGEFKRMGIEAKRFALADELKADLDDFLIEKFKISAFTTNPKEKKIIRPLLVAYGKAHRIKSNGLYWTSKLEPSVNKAISEGIVPIITDLRYAEYEFDEVHWLRDALGGFLVHLSRYGTGGKAIQPPNEDERINDPKVLDLSDFPLFLPTVQTPEEDLKSFGRDFLEMQYAK